MVVVTRAIPSESGGRRVASLEEAVYLDLVRTIEFLSRPLIELLKSEDLSTQQYNVLRILRGAPEGLTCGEIADRMVTRDPDVTRLLDRLEKRKLVRRARDTRDRRVVLTRLAPAGLDVLSRLDEPVQHAHRKRLGHLGATRLRALAELLESCRGGEA
jgi:DNA-binding MarR family transcriptional regulator